MIRRQSMKLTSFGKGFGGRRNTTASGRKDNVAKIKVEKSSGNVYQDLGFAEASTELAKAELARRISEIIEQRGLTQAQAAKALGVDQPKVSALARGRLGGFSTERLFKFLNALDREVEIVVRPVRRKHSATVWVRWKRREDLRGR